MSQKRNGSNSESSEGSIFIIVLAVAIFALIMWMMVGEGFSILMSHLRRLQLMLFMPFFHGAAELWGKLVARQGTPLTFSETTSMLTLTGNYVRWLYVPPIALMGIYLYMKSPRSKFRKVHTMSSLSKQEAKLWPEIAPVAGRQLELVSGDITQGPWAVSMTEWEFAEKYGLAQRGGAVNRDAARDIFIKQLGPLWAGPQALPVHARAILAAFILRIAGKKEESLAAFRKMGATFATSGISGMDTSWVDAALAAHGKHPNVRRVYERHAYVFTVMATMEQIARADGVLPSPLFIWLKTVDRRLWYTLNNVGRYSFHVECAGIMSHWLFEKSVRQACPSPMVEKALDGFEEALTEYSDDDSLERLYS